MVYKKNPAQKNYYIIFLLLFTASLILAGVQIRSGAGFGIGFWFPPLYFFLLLAVTYNLYNIKRILGKLYKPLIYIFYCGMFAFCIIFIIFCVLITGYQTDGIPDYPDPRQPGNVSIQLGRRLFYAECAQQLLEQCARYCAA